MKTPGGSTSEMKRIMHKLKNPTGEEWGNRNLTNLEIRERGNAEFRTHSNHKACVRTKANTQTRTTYKNNRSYPLIRKKKTIFKGRLHS